VACFGTRFHYVWYSQLDSDWNFRKTPWKLSVTRKANARARLKKVDAVIEAVRASGVQCASLVRAQS
jgi:hypothetical protein